VINVPLAVTASDGRTVHVLVTASPILDRGEVTGALVVWQDVSTLESACAGQAALHREPEVRADGLGARETGLRRHRQLLDAILGALPCRVSLWSRDERLAWANMRFAEELGEPREALVGRTWHELRDSVAAVEPLVREVEETIMAGTPVSREVEVAGPGGPEWRACTFLPFGRGALLVISEDITERKEAAAELERLTRKIEAERDRLATILDAIPDAISIHDRDDRYVYVNPALMSAARASSEDILGRSWPERGLDLDRIAPLTNAVHDAFASGEPRTAIYDCPVDGVVRTYHALAVPLRDAGKTVAQVIVSSRDITHNLATEAALRESEERLRLAQDSANVAVWDWDVRTGLYTSTPEFFRLYGLEEGRTLTYGQWRECVHPDDVARVETESQAVLARGESFDLEHRIVRPSGEIRWIQGIGRGVCDEQGEVVRVLGVNIDITARKAAEEVLATTVEQYRQALNNPLMGYALCEIVTDGAGRPQDFVFLDVNPAFEAFTGLAREHVLNRRVTEIFVPAEVAELVQIYGNVALTGEPRTFQYSIPSLGRSYEVAAFSPQHGRFIAFFKDVTKRESAEKALAESEAKYRNLVELAPDAIMILQDSAIVFANPAAVAMLGFGRADDLIGGPGLEIIHPRTREPVEWNIEADLRGEESPLTVVDVVRPDGTTVTVQGRGARIPFRGRTAIQVVLRDVTEEMRAEEELRRSNEELQRFAYVASHDLQEPLRSIISFSQLLDRRYKGRLDADADDYINFIVEGGNRMQSLIRDLLQFSRLETGARPLVRVDARRAVADALAVFNGQIADAGGEVTVEPLPTVTADPAQLEQVFANLIGNAIKYRRPDVPPKIRISANRTGGWWQFAVADNGIGIEPEYYDQIFVIFQRLHTKDAYPGTGIGLAIVKRIVERHGGTVSVESTPGEGSTFIFTLPAV
jgi:PAS domain S-box-containing protein